VARKRTSTDKEIRKGRGPVGNEVVAGMKERGSGTVIANHVKQTSGEVLQKFVRQYAKEGSTLYTDEAATYLGLSEYEHLSVKHSVGQYVDDMTHTNGIESFWSMLKRSYHGTYHHLNPKHLQRYIAEFARRHNVRELDTIRQMEGLFHKM